jgi:hypothetical protein
MTTTAPDIHVLSADSTREDVIEALGHVCHEAHRAPAVVARFACSEPTRWDKMHAFLDELLTLWEAAE